MNRLLFGLALACAACGGSPPAGVVVGPFDGSAHRFVVDGMTLPTTQDDAAVFGDDLNGDGAIDDELGHLLAALVGQNDGVTDPSDMIAARVVDSIVVIQADDLADDPVVGISYYGSDGAVATPMGGELVDGRLASNRARVTDLTGTGTVVIPVFADADPSVLAVQDLEIELVPDGSGAGFDAKLHGAILRDSVLAATRLGLRQMLNADPGAHSELAEILDDDHDGTITDDELTSSTVIESLEAPDLPGNLLSFGIAVHLSPCAAGACVTAPPADHCADRVRDQDETDVDCGGSGCMPCGPGFACAVPSDCQSPTCAHGTCTQPSCTDGVEDGFEGGSDCGGLCAFCDGDFCTDDGECRSGRCSMGYSCVP